MGSIFSNLSTGLEFLKWGLLFWMSVEAWRYFRLPSLRWIWAIWAINLIAKPLNWFGAFWSMDVADYGEHPISPAVFDTMAYSVYSHSMWLSYLLTPIVQLLIVILILSDAAGLLEKLRPEIESKLFVFLAWARRHVVALGVTAVVLTILANALTLILPVWASVILRGGN